LYITKGDANNGEDLEPVSKKMIAGKVFFTVPFLGYGLAAIRNPIGFSLLIIVPAGIIIYDQVKVILAEMKKKKKDNEPEKLENNTETKNG
jgi:signal peptidase